VFKEFDKIGRLKRDMVVTEKIDGTNAQVHILPLVDLSLAEADALRPFVLDHSPTADRVMLAGSRNRYITPTDDNFGFAKWVQAHADELWALGEGRHYGEWWGSGVQRGYGLTNGEKRFSLFNVNRWGEATPPPTCCSVVPVLKRWTFDTTVIDAVLADLVEHGSYAAPGFMKPEGIVVFQAATRTLFKRTIDKDDEPKSKASAA
jgi:hypothetical protein